MLVRIILYEYGARHIAHFDVYDDEISFLFPSVTLSPCKVKVFSRTNITQYESWSSEKFPEFRLSIFISVSYFSYFEKYFVV